MTIGIRELSRAASHMQVAFRSPLLPLFGLVTGLEALAVYALPDMTAKMVSAMLGGTLLGVFDAGPHVAGVLGLVLVMFALDLFRTALWSGLRRVTLGGETLLLSELARDAMSRIGALFVTQQLIGVFVLLVTAVCFLIGVSIQIFPHALVTFTLAPALYAVVALRRSIPHALSQAARITRHNLIAVFGIQGALLALGYWISEFFQHVEIAPMVGTYAALSLLMCYRFVAFFSMATLFLALDEAGEFER